ncbi:hypothetical protein E2C01_025661 [Portunus trituberculatus]|uniref:Uncharacterized protein n=1 Tax=Portunus trituberculatus TaxID=210409 RepID=A0A5B7EDI1_PORTR|nr:hypothetical protein [Portunus trituberculatus]
MAVWGMENKTQMLCYTTKYDYSGDDTVKGASDCQGHTLPHHCPLTQTEAAGEGCKQPVGDPEEQPRAQEGQGQGQHRI